MMSEHCEAGEPSDELERVKCMKYICYTKKFPLVEPQD
jgi:hypothetical protein